ncbi:MAG: FAD:protein FMN transferase [Chromatiales bacterium]|nr:FAD:protein FMN transferase [Chromatiales bacterium]
MFRTAARDWYAFGTGELARVNARLARGDSTPVSPELAPLIKRAMDFHARSGGLFDPGVCALVRLWQFDSEEALAVAEAPPPDTEIQALRARQGTLADLRFDGRTASAARPLCIDLGGMAKGTVLEQARAVLAKHGIRSALVDIGGSSQLAIGRKGRRPWSIGLLDPRSTRVFGRLVLAPGEAASTSGDYERGYERDGRRYHHILDPATGKPTAATAGVTVLAGDAELADAASTALMVAGPGRFREVCAALGIADALLITTTGDVLTTPGMATRLQRDNDGRIPVLDWRAANPDL